jgi:Tol biopolymer transport system component
MRPLVTLVAAIALLIWIHGSAVATTSAPLLAFSAEVAGNTDIYVAHLDGSGLARLTRSPGADFDPSWSPDRTKIAYRCQTGTSSDICIIGVNGSQPADITNWPGDEWSPAWSPGSAWIAFFADHTDLGSLWLIHPDGTGAHRLIGGGEYPSWSPNGKRLAYSDMRTREVAIVNVNGTHKRLLARHPAYDGSASFSPTGRRIAFDSQRGFRHVRESGIGPEFEIYTMGVRGRRLRRLTHNHAEDRFPDFGPDGRLVFSEGGQLWIEKPDGSHRHRLPLHGSFPDW